MVPVNIARFESMVSKEPSDRTVGGKGAGDERGCEIGCTKRDKLTVGADRVPIPRSILLRRYDTIQEADNGNEPAYID
jgi:hypothetical protein